MNNRLVHFSAMVRVAVLVLLAIPPAAHAASRSQTINVVMDNSYPPYVFLNSNNEPQGILIDQWKLWEQKTGIHAKIAALPWNEALRRMKAGEFDVIDTIFRTDARSGWLDFSKAYARLEVSAFFDKQISGIHDASSLKDFIVAAKSGDDAVELLKRHGVTNVLLFDSYEAIVRAAKEHKVTVFVADTPPALYYLHQQGIIGLYKQSPPLNSGEFHRAVKKGDQELLKVIENGFDRISSEELSEIEHAWSGSSLTDGFSLKYVYAAAGSLGLLILALFVWNRVLKRGVERRTSDLKASEERTTLILNSIAEGIYGVDLKGICTFCNPAALQLLGYDQAGEVVGKKIHQLIHHTRSNGSHYHSKDCRIYCSYRAGKGIHIDDEVFWRSDGTSFPVEYWAQPVMRNGVPIGAVTAFTDISERRRAEQALRENEERYRSLFNNMLEGFAHCRMLYENGRPTDFIYLDVNNAFEKLTGLKNIIGKRVTEAVPGIRETDPGLFELYGRVAMTGRPERFEAYLKSLNTWFAISVYSSQKEHFVAVFDVITERKKAEEALIASERRFREILENISLIGIMLDTNGSIVMCNKHLLAQTGWERPEIMGRNWFELFLPPEVRDDVHKGVFVASLSTGDIPTHYENPIVTREGERRLIAWSNIVLRDISGAITGVASIGEDITERKRAEQTLQNKTELLERIFSTTHFSMVYLDKEFNFIRVNTAYAQACGYPESFFPGKNHFQLYPHAENEAIFRRVVETGVPFTVRAKPFLFPDHPEWGTTYWDWTLHPLKDGSGTVEALLFVLLDVTENKRAEQSLRESEEKFRTLFEESNDVFYISTPAGKFLEINPAGLALFGYSSREELLAIDIGRELYVSQEDRDRFVELVKRTGHAKNHEIRMRRKDGSILNVAITSTAVRNRAAEDIVFRGIIRDETERKKLEEQLRQSQKMESIGTLAGGVAHDFNNILSAISGYGQMTLGKMGSNDPLRPNLQQILEAADRAAHLTHDLLLFSRKQPINKRPVDLNEGVQKLSKFLVRVIGEDIAFKTMLSGGTIPILADKHQIDQVMMNLATNARDAMPRGGRFTITTDEVWLNEGDTSAHGLGTAGKYALLSVSDTGVGMDEATQQRIFEPFFTTKEVGKGTGLGMSVVYGIVKRHDGMITVHSEPGHGTTFKIYLPINETAQTEEKTAPVEEDPVGGAETILLAEDDRTVRDMTRMILEDFGYTVITAVDGFDAVKQFTANKERIQLLLLDLIMPNKTGKDAYDEIRALRPGIKVIFASGYDPDMVRHKALLEQNVPVVYKPVPMNELLKKIRAVLDA